jgi:luciferase family oxidoreductase group 1
VPIYLLGSSDFSARLAGELGLPFAFASHFAPDYLLPALQLYRSGFKSSPEHKRPYAIVGAGAYVAETDEEARHLFTSAQQQVLSLIRGHPGKLPPPVESMDHLWNAAERSAIEHRTQYTAVGSVATVQAHFERMLSETAADEFIVTAQIHEHAARLRSFELLAGVLSKL